MPSLGYGCDGKEYKKHQHIVSAKYETEIKEKWVHRTQYELFNIYMNNI